MKFFFGNDIIVNNEVKKIKVWEVPRPKKKIELPKLFNQYEVAAIINNTVNKKHKVMLMLAYSAGLRVSGVVALKTNDIDSNRITILIRQAKGKKDGGQA